MKILQLHIRSRLPFFCRAFHYNAENEVCLLSGGSSSSKNLIDSKALSFYQEVCLDRGNFGN